MLINFRFDWAVCNSLFINKNTCLILCKIFFALKDLCVIEGDLTLSVVMKIGMRGTSVLVCESSIMYKEKM